MMTVTRRLRRRRDHVAARHVPAPSEDAFKSAAACGAVLVVGPGGGTRFGMGGGRSRCGPLSPNRPSRTCVQVREFKFVSELDVLLFMQNSCVQVRQRA